MTSKQNEPQNSGPKYFINISGKEYEWDKNTITTADIRNLAGWNENQIVIEINLKNGSRENLKDDIDIELKPGHGFSKKIEFDTATVTPTGAHGYDK